MLKFLTHKLRTHSLNEDDVCGKVEERDSGTESDDETARDPDLPGDLCADVIMKWNDVTDISGCGEACACAPPPPPEPDLLYDHHSSEEELEVINGAPGGGVPAGGESRRRGASSPPLAAPEKRKWPAPSYLDADADADDLAARGPSSDDDDTKVETPVRFRTSPPLEALKPRRAGAGTGAGSAGCGCGGVGAGCRCGPPSPRRRRPPAAPQRRHRPALDFDKMQQLRVGGVGGVGGVRAWRAGGAHTGELSVFCW